MVQSVLVVGATGTLGRQIARHAIEQGLQVKCLVRSPRKAIFLREWGAQLIQGDLTKPESLPPALKDIEAVIDAATTRPTDSVRIRQVDWEGKVNLIQACEQAGIEKFVFFSILNCEKYPQVPLMEIKHCTEKFLAETPLNYTVLQTCGFFQNLIGEYAIPILENQTIWVGGENTPIAYMNTQDIAKFAVKALFVPAPRQTYPVAGLKAWLPTEIIQLCEKLSGRTAKTAKMPVGVLHTVRRIALAFEWAWGFAERMAYADVLASGIPFTADMSPVCATFGIDPAELTTLEDYLQDYFSRILRKLKELDYKEPKLKAPF
ncbi:MAG: NmrA family NAD(P)-binding protein [Pseudanabaenaceae cyanobacterium]